MLPSLADKLALDIADGLEARFVTHDLIGEIDRHVRSLRPPGTDWPDEHHFSPVQRLATDAVDASEFVLFGGARGGGKSFWLRWELVYRLVRWAIDGHRHVRVGLFCEDYRTLYDRQITYIDKEFPEWLGYLQYNRSEFRLTERFGGGVVALRNLREPEKYRSTEFAVVAVDELTNDREKDFQELRASKRWPGIAATKFFAVTNPTGTYARWVRQYWIEDKLPPELKPKRDEFVFVPALPDDNPALPREYVADLETLPSALRKAWRFGDWFAKVEGVVYADFDADNVVDDVPDVERPFEIAYDDGYVDPRVILWIQRSGTDVLVFDELYHSRHLPETCLDEMLAKCRAGWWGEEHVIPDVADDGDDVAIPRERLPEIAIGDPSAVELKKRMRRADIVARSPATKAQRDIVGGVQKVRALIRDGQGVRSLRVHKRCSNLIAELGELYRYPDGARAGALEKPVDADNHAADALRYWVVMRT